MNADRLALKIVDMRGAVAECQRQWTPPGWDRDRIKGLIYAGWDITAIEYELDIEGVEQWRKADDAWLRAHGRCVRCEVASASELCADCRVDAQRVYI